MPVEVVLYSRQNCHLCHIARDVIEAAQRRFRLDIQLLEVDIDQNPELHEKFDTLVPVVSIAGREVFEYRIDQESFRAAVQKQMKETTP